MSRIKTIGLILIGFILGIYFVLTLIIMGVTNCNLIY